MVDNPAMIFHAAALVQSHTVKHCCCDGVLGCFAIPVGGHLHVEHCCVQVKWALLADALLP